MARTIWTAALLLLVVPLAAGCLEGAEPARSIPLESIAPRPPPAGVGQAVVVEFDLEEFHVATRFNGPLHEDLAEAALNDMGYARAADGTWTQQARGPDGVRPGGPEAARVVVAPAAADGEAGFWFNMTYPGVELGAPTQSEASALADEEWREREPHFLGTLSAFEQRTGWAPEGAPALTYTFVADVRSEP